METSSRMLLHSKSEQTKIRCLPLQIIHNQLCASQNLVLPPTTNERKSCVNRLQRLRVRRYAEKTDDRKVRTKTDNRKMHLTESTSARDQNRLPHKYDPPSAKVPTCDLPARTEALFTRCVRSTKPCASSCRIHSWRPT